MKLVIKQLAVVSDSLVRGTIYWEHESRSFPGASWTDNANVVLDWWLDSITPLAQGRPDKLLFMEGPYCLLCTPTPGLATVGFVGQANGADTDFRGSTPIAGLGEEILTAAERMSVQLGGWHPPTDSGCLAAILSGARRRLTSLSAGRATLENRAVDTALAELRASAAAGLRAAQGNPVALRDAVMSYLAEGSGLGLSLNEMTRLFFDGTPNIVEAAGYADAAAEAISATFYRLHGRFRSTGA